MLQAGNIQYVSVRPGAPPGSANSTGGAQQNHHQQQQKTVAAVQPRVLMGNQPIIRPGNVCLLSLFAPLILHSIHHLCTAQSIQMH